LELGLSRIAASELQKIFPTSDIDFSNAREKLLDFDPSPHKLSSVIVAEIDKVRGALLTLEV